MPEYWGSYILIDKKRLLAGAAERVTGILIGYPIELTETFSTLKVGLSREEVVL